MSAYITLEHVLKEILEVIKPRQEDRVSRSQVIDELRGVIGSVESLRGGWREMQRIPWARVPILKFKSSRQSISCDVSVDNLQGQMKSKLLLWISEIDGRFRDMVLLVKEWAKAHGINDSTSETFNSYSLTLLVIFHFQTCEPAILPPLEDIYTGNVADDLQGVRTVAEACADNIRKFRNKYRLANRSSLSKLFVSFLAKIEDPFEQQENSARTVNMSGLRKISEAFESSHRRLISADQNEDQGISTKKSLLATLVQERVSELIGGAYNGEGYSSQGSLRNLAYNGVGYRSQGAHGNVHLPSEIHTLFQNTRTSETQHRFRDMRIIERCSNNSTMTETVQADHNQGQHSGDGERPNSSGFSVGGLLLGGLVAGISLMFAPQIAKAADDRLRRFRNDSEEDSDVRTCLCICNP
uniref:Poly(A) RNA polymerase mitochondrial-like central palm domain-containing protein n=1 Tax=Fagus sylvatica TaxID=28930 RepID=A0A2N9FEH1_FAGSY